MVEFPTPEEFSDWRRANPTRGQTCDPSGCPIAECLKDRGAVSPAVLKTHWIAAGHRDFQDIPKWATKWIDAYDRGKEINPPVPAELDRAEVKPGMRMVDGEWAYSAAWL